MFDKIWQSVYQAGDALSEFANNLNQSSREKTMEDWLSVLPRLESYGFELTNFSLGISINPGLEAELWAPHDAFPPERIEHYLSETRDNTALQMIFSTVKSTYALYRKSNLPLRGVLIVRLRVRISPELRVIIGSPYPQEV
jgi:hypothetical protein